MTPSARRTLIASDHRTSGADWRLGGSARPAAGPMGSGCWAGPPTNSTGCEAIVYRIHLGSGRHPAVVRNFPVTGAPSVVSATAETSPAPTRRFIAVPSVWISRLPYSTRPGG
jgi:hypothetical protein